MMRTDDTLVRPEPQDPNDVPDKSIERAGPVDSRSSLALQRQLIARMVG
jgi:hypothetical protein